LAAALSLSKFYDWRTRYGKVNEHNCRIPRDHWLTDEERQAVSTTSDSIR